MSKIRFSYHRGANFEDFGCCNMRCFFGAVFGGFWGGFWEVFGRFWLDFWVFKKRPILKPKLEAEKVISDARKGG